MRLRRLPVVAACLLNLFLALSAQACLNDTASSSAEGEFRSRYESFSSPKSPESHIPWMGLGAIAGGVALGVAGVRVFKAVKRGDS